ncbi:hypothetical protein [Ruegeria sp. HKCCA0370]|uniref:hypothetical protein n=1 Tax=Ruegeria sp. HKCCA0370 TaxID=2682995 RepID=UPI0014898BF9|nr:hypothetical protein [Ruegeria sp. HKCCA0370]
MSSHTNQPQVRRRRVFYIPGYDPMPPRRYRELYRSESQKQARISGYEIAISQKTTEGRFGWRVTSEQDGLTVETEFEVLVWSDIVRDSMSVSISATYWQLARTAWIYISTGTLWRLMRLRKGPVIAALYPVAMLVSQLLIALALAWACIAMAGWWGVFPGAAIAVALLLWFRKVDNRLFAYYLMHDYAYSAQLSGQMPVELRERLSSFREAIQDALNSDVDEVLVVGHSSGAHLGVSVLAELVRKTKVHEQGAVLSFLSLGQVVPMVSFLPQAHDLRSDLHFLSTRSELSWIDVSAPGDGCAFALCDPVAVTGVADADKRWPLVLSAAFSQTLSPERWKALRWRFFRLHFQYLCAFDKPESYDYFRITAGPLTLGQRFADREASRSRIETPVSKFTSVQP